MTAPPGSVSGVVLAGGRSRRMGQDKALLRLDGTTFLERSIRTLQPVASEVVIAADRADRYAVPGVRVIADPVPGCGPLGGILAALEDTVADAVCVLACDLPFVTTELIRLLAMTEPQAPLVFPSTGDVMQPLCGRYAATLHAALRTFLLEGGRAVMDFIRTQEHVCVAIGADHPVYRPRLLANVNTEEEFHEAERAIAGNPP